MLQSGADLHLGPWTGDERCLGLGRYCDGGFQKTLVKGGLLRCQSGYTVRGHVGWSGRAKSGQISGSGFWACWNLDFGVQVGLGEHIETMPLSSPSVPNFGVRALWKLLSGVRVGLSVQTTRESGCESRGQISVSAEGV